MAAECLPPAVSGKLIEEAAERAIQKLKNGKAASPFKIEPPITMILEFVQSEMADKAMIMPGATRLEDRKVKYVADDIVTIYFAFRTLLALAR